MFYIEFVTILYCRKVAEITVPIVTESVSEVEELSDDYYTKEIILDQSKSSNVIRFKLTNRPSHY